MFLHTCFGTLLVFLTTVKAAPKPFPTGLVSPPSSSPDSQAELFLEKELQKINKYRLMHAATPLQLSLDLTNKAELWATQLANEDKEKIDVNSKYGQNIFSTKNTNEAVTQSVQSWYNAIRFYDFHSAKGSLKSAYFTQLVWAGSKAVGIGKAKSASGKTYIVALFDPPGNKGNYLHNVLPVTGSGVGKIGPSTCPNGYQLYNNICYKFFPGPVNWVQASEKCAAQFSTLASINSEAEDLFIRTLLTSGGVSEAWIGVSDVSNHGIMAWLDGSEPNFMNWDYYQNNFPGKKCGVIYTNFNWKYKPCYGARGFVCKKPLRGITEYLVILRYESKLWTDNLYYPGSTRYQALSRHIQEAFLDVFGDYDWFEQVTLDHFSKGEGDKILAYIKLRFTPDDDSPADPIQLLRNAIQGSDSPKRSSITGILHGEKVQLVNATMVVEEQTPGSCPGYCVSSQCMPTACNPWCCDPLGQQFFQNSFGAQQPQVPHQQLQQQQHPGYNLFGSAQPQYIPPNQVPAYPPPTAYQVPQQAQFRPQLQPQYQVPPRPPPYQIPAPPSPQHYQYPIPPPPLQYPGYQPQPPPQQFQNPVLRPQPYPYTVPPQPQQYRYQVPPRPQTLPSQQYLIVPRQPQPLHQAPQPYQAIPRTVYPQPWPVYPQPQPMIQQPVPQFFQMNQNTKDKQKLQGSKVEPGQAKSPVQLQGVVFSYPYSVPAPVPAPIPAYIPQQYYQPTVQHPKQEVRSKEKGNESQKESEGEKSHEKSHVKPLPEAAPQPSYPFMGLAPQPYVSSYPYPIPSGQTAWRVRIYRPVLTIARPPPPPVFTPGYPLLNVPQPAYQPYPIPSQPYRPPPQPASPGLLPIGQRKEFQQISSPSPAYPMQQPLPFTPYRPPYPYFNHSPLSQAPQSAPLDR